MTNEQYGGHLTIAHPRDPSTVASRTRTDSKDNMSQRWKQHVRGDSLPWLLEDDNPSVRYFALRDLLGRPAHDPDLVNAQSSIMASRPVREILEAQYPAGYWVKPGRGYSPKYRATVWQLMFLADLGATSNEAIDRACRFILEHSVVPEEGLFSATKAGTGTIACLNGNLLRSLQQLGYGDHPTVRTVSEALARMIVEDGFNCRANSSNRADKETWLPCAWGAAKALRAFALIPRRQRSPVVKKALDRGADLLLSRDLATADYPGGSGLVSPLWFKLGFPLGYASDILEALDVLAQLGHGGHPSLRRAIDLVLEKQDSEGRWPLERTLTKTWTSFGKRNRPSKWVTLRAMNMLSRLP